MQKFIRGLVDLVGILVAITFLGWAYLYLTPGAWESLQASVSSWQMPGKGLTALDWVTIAAVGLGLASTVYLLLKGGAILRGPAKVTLIR